MGELWECPRCGVYVLDFNVRPFEMPEAMAAADIDASVLSHKIRRAVENKARVVLSEEKLPAFGAKESLPNPEEQTDNLILWIGNEQKRHSDWVSISRDRLAAIVGSAISQGEEDLTWLHQQLLSQGLFDRSDPSPTIWRTRLTMKGWTRYDELTRKVIAGRYAFMAMAFSKPEVQLALDKCFKPAAARAGFELRRLDEGQPAGLIDYQIRTRIRTARLVIADLTHDNDGAYFEAGFAEGLGVDVIYTCEANKFKDTGTHFDTSHMVTILWDATDLKKAELELTNKIRNTLPDIAKMQDDYTH